MKNHEEILNYFKTNGVSLIFLFRRNLLRRMISVLANSYDRENKLLNGTHKSHVHSPHEVRSLSILCGVGGGGPCPGGGKVDISKNIF